MDQLGYGRTSVIPQDAEQKRRQHMINKVWALCACLMQCFFLFRDEVTWSAVSSCHFPWQPCWTFDTKVASRFLSVAPRYEWDRSVWQRVPGQRRFQIRFAILSCTWFIGNKTPFDNRSIGNKTSFLNLGFVQEQYHTISIHIPSGHAKRRLFHCFATSFHLCRWCYSVNKGSLK